MNFLDLKNIKITFFLKFNFEKFIKKIDFP